MYTYIPRQGGFSVEPSFPRGDPHYQCLWLLPRWPFWFSREGASRFPPAVHALTVRLLGAGWRWRAGDLTSQDADFLLIPYANFGAPVLTRACGWTSSERKPLVFWLEEGQSPGCRGQGWNWFWIQCYVFLLPPKAFWDPGSRLACFSRRFATSDTIPPVCSLSTHSICDCRPLPWWWLMPSGNMLPFSILDDSLESQNLKIRCLSKKNCIPVLLLIKYCPQYHHLFTIHCLTG